ncbi:MAG: oxalate decarboxylase [Mycobacterium sp.]|nr:oxalate decarboxylase [Mycobacterium sp.]
MGSFGHDIELTYCVSGTSLVSVLDTYSKFSSFTVSAGEMFHIDSGSLHHIENIGEDAAEFIRVSQRTAGRLRSGSGFRRHDRRRSG